MGEIKDRGRDRCRVCLFVGVREWSVRRGGVDIDRMNILKR